MCPTGPRPNKRISECRIVAFQAAENFTCGDDPGRHVAAIQRYVDAGFDEVYISQIGPRYKDFFTAYGERILPRLRADDSETAS
ncbi:hypothetical protein GCM10009838_79750 [Catenulispora subtropica]|uniref:Uncharacterized protein n=1 Tax=Catenulispora subtropica TaxID=450798 RepID=A0ABN2T8S0_9ACTN